MYSKIAKPAATGSNGRLFAAPRGRSYLARGFHHAWLLLRRWNIETEAIRHLESLDDGRLEDLGIERREIPLAVRGMLERQEIRSRSGNACGSSDAHQRLAA